MAPPALSPPPRQARLPSWNDDPGRGALMIVGITFLAIGVIQGVTFFAMGEPWVDLALDRSHSTTEGRFLGSGVSRFEHVNGRRPLVLHYRFEPRDGQTRVGSSKTLAQGFYMPGVDEPVQVEYLFANPAWNRMEGTRHSVLPRTLYLVPVACGIVGIVCLFLGRRARRRLLSLLQDGEVGEGEIVEVRNAQPGTRRSRSKRLALLIYRWTDGDGLERTGRTHTRRLEEAAALSPGERIPLLLDPFRRGRAVAVTFLPDRVLG